MKRCERRLTLCENMRAVPYVPFYLALAGDFWRSEGLDITHVVSPSTAQTATKLLDGSVDVSWGGPMRVMMHHDADPACPLVCFAQVVERDPFLLVGRGRRPGFRFRDLVGLRVAPAGDVPTPWMTFQDDLQRAGLEWIGKLIRALRLPAEEVDAAWGRHLTINATGAIAALLGEIGVPREVMRGIAVVSRSAGLVGHIREEQFDPAVRRMWDVVSENVRYAGK